jgi:hypothetical protein
MTDLIKTQAPASLALAGACILVLVLTVAGCLPPRGQPQPSRERNEELTATRDRVQEITIPPLDAAAPTETETATFALG